MGTMITLSLGEVPVDYGKNHYWTSHAWLFPPSSDEDLPYIYADNLVVTRPGLSATLDQVRFRMDNLGYSLDETRDRYNAELDRWNRTYSLRLPFERFLATVTSIQFETITQQDQEDFKYDILTLLLRMLAVSDPQDEDLESDEGAFSGIEDFIQERVPVHVLVRCLAERSVNLGLLLTWGYQELIENGWEERSTLMEIDRAQSTLNLIRLYGRLQDQANCHTVAAFDKWLVGRGAPCNTTYIEQGPNGWRPRQLTLPSAVRNMIHHPENRHQVLADTQLEQAIELLLQVASPAAPRRPQQPSPDSLHSTDAQID